jgi:SAM-dependent methyltransferase
MLDMSLCSKLTGLYEACAMAHGHIEQKLNIFGSLGNPSAKSDELLLASLNDHLFQLCEGQAKQLSYLAGEDVSGWEAARSVLQKHPFQMSYLLQSELIQLALRRNNDHAGDKNLLQLICRNADEGRTPYSVALNRYFLTLPLAEAVRARVAGMEQMIRFLPAKAHVLSVGSGPALEVQWIDHSSNADMTIDLLEQEMRTITGAMGSIRSRQVNHIRCNPFDIIKGEICFERLRHMQENEIPEYSFYLKPGSYDLIYALGFLNYVRDFPEDPTRGATGLTSRLFHLLKPGGRLVLGNCLTPGGANRHSRSHQFVLEIFMDWKLNYRTPQDIYSFTDTLPASVFKAELMDETLVHPAGTTSVMGFLVLERLI